MNIVLSAINAKWIHPSPALRLLKANLGTLEEQCVIIEFNLRQPLKEKVDAIISAKPHILGFSVSIWNHLTTLELLKSLEHKWGELKIVRPVIVLGGPEVSWLLPDAEIFHYANYIVRGEGEQAFRKICEQILQGTVPDHDNSKIQYVDTNNIKTAYHLYTDDDLKTKLIYVESSRGCAFNCEFCLSAIKTETAALPGFAVLEKTEAQQIAAQPRVRFFPLEQFLAEMDVLIKRGVRTFKFLDRTFNLDIQRAVQILDFFLDRIDERISLTPVPFVVHFEMVPSRFPPELMETLSRFPAGTLRLEIGIQTLNAEVSMRIGRPSDPDRELETLRLLREKTNAIIHADLIAGLPGEDFASFGAGFDRLLAALTSQTQAQTHTQLRVEIQSGILKLLPGAPIARHSAAFGMRYNSSPPYEVIETAALPQQQLERIKNFARFWELIVNRGLLDFDSLKASVFDNFMALSDSLFAHFGRNWGIDKQELVVEIKRYQGRFGDRHR